MARVILFLLIVAIALKYSHQQAIETTTEEATEETTVAATEPSTVSTSRPPSRPPTRPPSCRRRNEVYKRCRTCEPTCRFPFPTCRSRICRPGCQCRIGFLRRRDGACVTRRYCKVPKRG